jgi:hypothetical protein
MKTSANYHTDSCRCSECMEDYVTLKPQVLPSAESPPMHELYPEYFRDVSGLTSIDTYRINDLFGMTDSAVIHAAKKLILAGDRTGGKTFKDDIKEARDTLTRRLNMWEEDDQKNI